MSNVGDALSGGGSDATGISDTTLSDASLGDQMAGGTGDLSGGNDPAAFGDAGNSFNSFNDIANAVSGGSAGVGGTPTAVQSASMTPPAAAGATGGDPTGAAGGTQSGTAPGSTPTDPNQPQGGKQQQNDPNYAPPQAVSQLKALLKQLNSGKPAGPTGPVPVGGQNAPFALPTLAAMTTGVNNIVGSQPAAARLPPLVPGETGPQSPQGAPPLEGGIPNLPGVAPGQTGPQSPQGADPGRPAVDAQGNPVTAAGTPASQTPLPPARPDEQDPNVQEPAVAGPGGDITVRKSVGKRAIPDAALPTKTGGLPLPTHKGGPTPAPAPQGPATSSIMRDISGVSTGSPTALADLAQAAKVIAPLIPLFAGLFGGGGRGRRFGGFHGGRFTHGFGGFGHLHGGQHPMGRGAWPYHHPQFGWHMHGRPPGPGWRPLHPNDAQGIVGGGMGGGQQQGQGGQDPNAPDPNNPPPETGGDQPSDDTFNQSGYGSNPFVGALVGQESGGQNIVSKTDKDSQGRTLAQGGNPSEISQGYFQIQNHPGGTWATYARQAGVDLSHYPTPRSAPLDVQWNVASRIPIGQWGHDTKAMLHQRFGQFDERLTLEQVASRSGRASGRLADAMPHASTRQPQNLAPAASIPTLPVTSQPMVAGGP
jgi:hypothetical protein